MKNLVLLFGAIFLIAFTGNCIYYIFFLIFLFTFLDAASLSRKDRKLTLRGRVIFPTGQNIPIEEGGILTVALQDVTIMDTKAKTVGKSIGKAIRFPMAFAIKYKPEDILPGHRYSLSVMIKNDKDELLYTNDMHIGVTPVGDQRTTLINAPVILVKSKKENNLLYFKYNSKF